MFFYKRKKLDEIEGKIDRLLHMMEKQSQDISDYEKDNRDFLSRLLIEKIESLSDENKCRIEDVEKGLTIAEEKITALVEKNTEDIKRIYVDQEKRDEAMGKKINTIRQNMEKDQKIRSEIADKLDLVENEIRLFLLNSVMEQIPEK